MVIVELSTYQRRERERTEKKMKAPFHHWAKQWELLFARRIRLTWTMKLLIRCCSLCISFELCRSKGRKESIKFVIWREWARWCNRCDLFSRSSSYLSLSLSPRPPYRERESAKLRKDKPSPVICRTACVSLTNSTWREKDRGCCQNSPKTAVVFQESSDGVPQSSAIKREEIKIYVDYWQGQLGQTLLWTHKNSFRFFFDIRKTLCHCLWVRAEALKNGDVLLYWHYQEQRWK